MSKKAVHFGASSLGRGLIAPILSRNGYSLVFVEDNSERVKQLQERASYRVTEVNSGGDKTNIFTIKSFESKNLSTDVPEIIKLVATADILTCTLGSEKFKSVAHSIAAGIDSRNPDRKPLAVIACENEPRATDRLRAHLHATVSANRGDRDTQDSWARKVEYGNATVSRYIRNAKDKNPLDLIVYEFSEWYIERSGFKNAPPRLHGVDFVENLDFYIKRKLYTVEFCHVMIAYFAHHEKIPDLALAFRLPEIKPWVYKALDETSSLIVGQFPHHTNKNEQKEYVENVLDGLKHVGVEDTARSISRAPLAQLQKDGIFTAAASESLQVSSDISGILKCVEMVLRFQNVPGNRESEILARRLKGKPEDATKAITSLDENHPLFGKIVLVVREVQGRCARCRHGCLSGLGCCLGVRSRKGTQGKRGAQEEKGHLRREDDWVLNRDRAPTETLSPTGADVSGRRISKDEKRNTTPRRTSGAARSSSSTGNSSPARTASPAWTQMSALTPPTSGTHPGRGGQDLTPSGNFGQGNRGSSSRITHSPKRTTLGREPSLSDIRNQSVNVSQRGQMTDPGQQNSGLNRTQRPSSRRSSPAFTSNPAEHSGLHTGPGLATASNPQNLNQVGTSRFPRDQSERSQNQPQRSEIQPHSEIQPQ